MIHKQTTFVDPSIGRDLVIYTSVTNIERRLIEATRHISIFPRKGHLVFEDMIANIFRDSEYRPDASDLGCIIRASKDAYRTEILIVSTDKADGERRIVRPTELNMGFYKKGHRQPFLELLLSFDDNAGRIYKVELVHHQGI